MSQQSPPPPPGGQHYQQMPPQGQYPPPGYHQNSQDDSHLKGLRIGYYIFGGLGFLGTLFMVIYIVIGLYILSDVQSMDPYGRTKHGDELAASFIIAIGGIFFVISAVVSSLLLVVAGRIKQRRSRTLILIMAGLICLSFPLGTTLGVLTFVVMSRPSVKAQFDDPVI